MINFLDKVLAKMLNVVEIFRDSFQTLMTQLLLWLPKLVISLIIWVVGQWLIELAAGWLARADIKGIEVDNWLLGKVSQILRILGKVILLLWILDYLGVGETITGALVNGLTFTIAITLGLAFGRALEPEASRWVGELKKSVRKTKK